MTFEDNTISIFNFLPCLVYSCLQFGGNGQVVVFDGNECVSLFSVSSDNNFFTLICQVEHVSLLTPKFS